MKIISILAILIFSILYLFIDRFARIRLRKSDPRKASYDSAQEALTRMGLWASWLTGLETLTITGMGYISSLENLELTSHAKEVGFYAITFLGTSILLSSWVIGSLPSIQQALSGHGSTGENDIHEAYIYDHMPIRLGKLVGLLHLYFVLGITLFIYFLSIVMDVEWSILFS